MSMLIKFCDPVTQQYRELKLEWASIGSRQIRVNSKLSPILNNNNFGRQIGLAVPLTAIWLNTKMAQKSYGLEKRKRKIDGWQWQQIRQTQLSMDSQMKETIFDETIRGKIYLFKFTLRDNFGNDLLLLDDGIDTWKNCCQIDVKSDFSKDELKQLHLKATNYVKSIVDEPNKLQKLNYLHRTKNEEYWEKIFTNPEGPTMCPFPKDNGGHAASPINNGQIDGIYFSARMKLNGELHEKSPYGTMRMLFHPAYLLDPDKFNLYFSDFYCYKDWATHRISLVAVPRESPKNDFCAQKLFPIDTFNNPFIRVRRHLNKWGVYEWICEAIAGEKLWMEIIFTKDLLLNSFQYCFEQVECISAFGEAKPGGLQNNVHCQICNIYPVSNAPSEPMPFAAQAINENGGLAALAHFDGKNNTAVFKEVSSASAGVTSVQPNAQNRKTIVLCLAKPTNIPPPQIPCQIVEDQQNIQNFHPQILPGPSNSFEPKSPDEKANKCPPADESTKKP